MPPAAVDPWRFHPHPEVDLIMLSAICAYWWATHRLGPRQAEPGLPAASRRQQCWFYGGVAVLWVFSEWPIHDISEQYLLSVHMVQHTFFSVVVPPMLLLGLPDWLTGWLLKNPVLGFLGHRVARPWPALLLFNFLNILMHWEPVVDHELRSEPLHFCMHLLLFSGSMCVWLPLVNSRPDLPRLSHPMKLVYAMGTTLSMVAPVTFLALATRPTYHVYASAPRLWGISHLADQQAGAGIMWLLHSVIMTGVITYVFFSWWAAEQRDPETRSWPERPMAPGERPDPLTWEAVEHEFERA